MLKKITLILGFLSAMPFASADLSPALKSFPISLSHIKAFQVSKVLLRKDIRLLGDARPSRIPFKVGDTALYDIDFAGFLNGTMNMFVREETAEGIWLQQDVDLVIQKQKIETLFDKETGAVKKVLIDGQEQKNDGPSEAPDIVESKPDTVTVPAGTFECSYVKLHDKSQNSDFEFWVNPELVPIMGLIKQVSQSQFGPVVLVLRSFEKK